LTLPRISRFITPPHEWLYHLIFHAAAAFVDITFDYAAATITPPRHAHAVSPPPTRDTEPHHADAISRLRRFVYSFTIYYATLSRASPLQQDHHHATPIAEYASISFAYITPG
jgi:hypothetical protein